MPLTSSVPKRKLKAPVKAAGRGLIVAETSAGAETGAGNKAPKRQLILLNLETLPANAHQITLTKVTSVANGNEVLVGLMLA